MNRNRRIVELAVKHFPDKLREAGLYESSILALRLNQQDSIDGIAEKLRELKVNL